MRFTFQCYIRLIIKLGLGIGNFRRFRYILPLLFYSLFFSPGISLSQSLHLLPHFHLPLCLPSISPSPFFFMVSTDYIYMKSKKWNKLVSLKCFHHKDLFSGSQRSLKWTVDHKDLFSATKEIFVIETFVWNQLVWCFTLSLFSVVNWIDRALSCWIDTQNFMTTWNLCRMTAF